jgi:hypothetical protein
MHIEPTRASTGARLQIECAHLNRVQARAAIKYERQKTGDAERKIYRISANSWIGLPTSESQNMKPPTIQNSPQKTDISLFIIWLLLA